MSIKTKTLLILFLSVSIIFALIIEAIGKDELILITNTRDGTISVISRTTNEVIKTINAGKKSITNKNANKFLRVRFFLQSHSAGVSRDKFLCFYMQAPSGLANIRTNPRALGSAAQTSPWTIQPPRVRSNVRKQ